MKVVETILQSGLIIYCMGCVIAVHWAYALFALPILGAIQVLSAAIYRVGGGKSKERTAYGIMVVLCLLLLFISGMIDSFTLGKFSLALSGATGVFYNFICWREILNPRDRQLPQYQSTKD